MNCATVFILAALGLAVLFALRAIRKRRCSGCTGNCAGCTEECSKQ